MTIIKANINHLDQVAPLFDSYRVFYNQASDLKGAKQFLLERFQNQDSIIYLAYSNDEAIGFTQLYPLFSSVAMTPMYLLNDLFVNSKHRGKGIGEALINKAKTLCTSEKNKGLALQTAFDNHAQYLYEKLDFIKETDLYYFWETPSI